MNYYLRETNVWLTAEGQKFFKRPAQKKNRKINHQILTIFHKFVSIKDSLIKRYSVRAELARIGFPVLT